MKDPQIRQLANNAANALVPIPIYTMQPQPVNFDKKSTFKASSRPLDSTIISCVDLGTGHQMFRSLIRLVPQFLLAELLALEIHKGREGDSHGKRNAQQDNVDWDRIAVPHFVGKRIEERLRKVEKTSETDDESVNFSERVKSEYFGGIVSEDS